MASVFKKLQKRYHQFKGHPLTRDHALRAWFNYIGFNIKLRTKGELKVKTISPARTYLRRGDSSLIGNVYYGLQEFTESAFLLHYLRKEDHFFDAGCNLGHYTMLASAVVGASSTAVEPVPSTHKQLQRNIELNNISSLVTTQNIGLSDQEGALHFSTEQGAMNRVVSANFPGAISVPVKTIDQLTSDLQPALLKIDVEGYEEFVLKGASGTLEHPELKAVIIELNFQQKHYSSDLPYPEEFLRSKGFEPFQYDPFHRKLNRLQQTNQAQFNTIFIRDLSTVTARIERADSFHVGKQQF